MTDMEANTDALCGKCRRKIIPSVSNRCMYCGLNLPEKYCLDEDGKKALMAEKMEVFKKNEEDAENIIESMRKDFQIDPLSTSKKSRKQRKRDNQEAVDQALASINSHFNTGQIDTSRDIDKSKPD